MDYSVDGHVTDIDYKEKSKNGMLTENILSFKFFNRKERCNATVTFASDDLTVDLYQNAVRFVKRLIRSK